MKKIILLVFICVLSSVKAQEEVKNLLNLPQTIEFNGTEFFLSWSKQQSPTLALQQYLPSDEKIENFNQLLNFSYFDRDIDLEQAVRQKVESIQQRNAEDKFAKVFDVNDSPDGLEHLMDFMVSGKTKAGASYIEYNVYRFKRYEKGKTAMLILAYAKRYYGEDLKGISKSVTKQRGPLQLAMSDYTIPNIRMTPTEKN